MAFLARRVGAPRYRPRAALMAAEDTTAGRGVADEELLRELYAEGE
ncbi:MULTISPECIES: hypothetical protein [unclassified Streptomyces]